MERSKSLQLAFWAVVCLAVQLPTAHAAIVISGDVVPADVNDWTGGKNAYVGKTADGELEINGGSYLLSQAGYIGYDQTATGVVTVDGSTWSNTTDLSVGRSGSGTLNISGGARVLAPGSTYVAYNTGSTGSIHFGTGGGTLKTGSLLASPTQLTGTGTVNTGSLISDVDLVLDSTASLMQTFVWDGLPGQNVTVHFNMTDNDDRRAVGAGWNGAGSLAIRGGIAIDSFYGHIGHHAGSSGVVTVDGAGSTWTNGHVLYVGRYGSGTLNVSGGAEVSNAYGYLGYDSDSTGVVTVDGAGSMWTNNHPLYIGRYGNGTLNISGGGEVSVGNSTYVAYEAGSTGSIHFGPGGGTLTTRSLFASPTQLTGTGTIHTRGLVSDVDLVFDSTESLTQALVLDALPEQNVTLQFNMVGSSSTNGYLGAGFRGKGSLTIRDGVTVSSYSGHIGYHAGSTGVVNVDGADSKWSSGYNLWVGREGSGTLNVTGGAEVRNTRYGYIGTDPGSTGLVTVDGADSKWTNDRDLFVGDEGSGTLSITAGGAVSNSSGTIGNESGTTGVVTVDGAGSKWTSSELRVGYEGSGTLNITGGAEVSNGLGYIGDKSVSTGAVTVDGAGSKWTNRSDLHVGNFGSGTLNIGSGAEVSVGGSTYVAYEPGSTGSIHFGPGGGTLTTESLFASPTQLTGTGTIHTRGLLSDVDLVFDSTESLTQTILLDGLPEQNVTVHLDMTGNPYSNDILDVGWKGHSSLTLRNGITIDSDGGTIGRYSGSTGVVTVDGTDSTWTNSNELYIGEYGSGTLNIISGATVSNNSTGYIGRYSGSTGLVTVDGAGSTWTNGGLYVSREGSGTLHISGGAAVSNSLGHIGYEPGSTGVVTVDGAGSTWSAGSRLYIGGSGSGTLNVTGGATVSNSRDGYIGRYSGSTGVVTVDGAGSNWTISRYLYVGEYGSGTLNITDGAAVSNNSTGYIGRYSGSTGLVTVDGAGSTWTNGGLYVGREGSGTLNISGGAAVSSSSGYIGGSTGVVTVDGAGSTWTNSGGLSVGGNGTLNISGGAEVSMTNGGDLSVGSGTLNISGGAEISVAGSTYVARYEGSTGLIHFGTGGGTLTTTSLLASPSELTGTGTIHTHGLVSDVDLVFDSSASRSQTIVFNSQPEQNVAVHLDMIHVTRNGVLGAGWKGNGSLTIQNGVWVYSDLGYIGYHPGSTGVVTVDGSRWGSSSRWACSDDLHVGHLGSGTLNITAGAAVSNKKGYINQNSSSTVDGAGSKWINSGDLKVSGTLSITGGAAVTNIKGYTSAMSVVTVDGAGSKWTNGGGSYFYVSGTLNVTGGGAVSNFYGRIGNSSGTTSVVTVDGAGSTWTNSGPLSVGYQGSGILSISGGAVVNNNDGVIGYGSGSTGAVTVDGAGSTWTNGGDLDVNRNGTLEITDGGAVSNSSGYIDNYSGLTDVVTVDGAGSTWTNSGPLYFSGSGTLAITGGAAVSNSDGYIGYRGNLTSAVTVDGAGSTWTNSGPLHVGYEGGYGTLNITGGAAVISSGAYINSRLQPASTVTVDGSDSMWTSSGPLYFSGSGTLSITGGAAVSDSDGFIGYKGSKTSMLTIDGAGSTWTNSGPLHVGHEGNGALHITNGADVSNTDGYIGRESDSTGVVTVDGAGSTWTNSGTLNMGRFYSGTLNITGGATVSAADVLIHSHSLLAVDVGNGSKLAIDGDVDFRSSCSLKVMLAGTPANGPHAPIQVGGLLDLSGAYAMVPQWQPGEEAASKFGGEYVVAAYGSLAGEFGSVGGGSGPYDIGEAYVAGVDYVTDNRITLSLHALLDGDTDLNGRVGLNDWDAFRNNFGRSETDWTDGNFDPWNNSVVDLTDWDKFRANFGKRYAVAVAEGGAAVVPEPGSLALLAVAALGLLAQAWWRRKR